MNTATATATITAPFALRDASPTDILESAAAVTRFLYEVSPHLTEDIGNSGLSEKGSYGLMLILEGLEKTIDAAVAAL